MELKNDRLVEFSPRRGCWVARMTRAEIEDACFARYLLESGAVSEERAIIDDDLVASLGRELGVMAEAVAAGEKSFSISNNGSTGKVISSASLRLIRGRSDRVCAA